MPDQYENPDVYPCSGSYTWTPAVPANFGGINPTVGFQNLIIDRGAFRNYYVPKRGEPNIKVTVVNSKEGNEYNPIINATRPLSVNVPVKQANNNNLVVYSDKSDNLVEFEFVSFASNRLSCVEITYDLSLLFSDGDINNYSTGSEAQESARNAIKSGAVSNANITTFITGLTPGTVKVFGVNGSTEKEIGTLNLTRIRTTQNESGLDTASTATSPEAGPTFATVRIKTATSILDRNAYPIFSKIRLKVNTDIISIPSSLVLIVKKIMFFTADRVNFRTLGTSKQLPCNALGYSMYFNGYFYPGIGLVYTVTGLGGGTLGGTATPDVAGYFFWPQDNRLLGCNVHIKLFNPDYRTGSPGFAHSLNLHIFIVDFPIFEPGFILPHFAVIIGPTGFTQQLLFYGNSSRLVKNNLTMANMTSPDFKQNNGYMELAKDNAATGIVRQIFPYKDYLDIVVNNQFFYEINNEKGSDIYQNIYVEQDGAVTNSEAYTGSLPRTSSYLNAVEAIATLPNSQRKTVKYGTFVSKINPTVYELFTFSDPCLIFKLNSESIPTSTFQEPGFMSAAIRCFVNDKTELFDTKLAYRIYAVSRNGDMNPNSVEALKHTFKIINGGTEKSYLESTVFDSSWGFTNVLVSGNIGAVLQDIFADQIINNAGETNSKAFNVFNNTVFDLYCAVYAFSVVNENFAPYDLTEYSSLDYPIVTFSIQNDFVLTLPIYYRKSYTSGGTIQAMRDFGNYGKYTPDTSEYVVVTTLFNGQVFNNEQPYDAVLNDSTGYNLLMTMVDGSEVGSQTTSFFVELKPDEINEYDFVVATDATSHARIAPGDWQIEFDFDSDVEYSIKFEIDLINATNSKLILKILNSEFNSVSQKENDQKEVPNKITANIQVPFFLPSGENIVLLRVYFKGSSPTDNKVSINSIKLLRGKNTLQYFSYTTKQPLAAPSNYYEDLPVQPNTFVGNCSQYILKFNPQSIPVIYNLKDGLYIDGCIYSPTWVVDMPENMELDYRGIINQSLFPTRASGIQPYQIFFRTATSNPVITVDTNKHASANLFVTVTNKETNTSDYAVKQFVTESFMRFFRYNTLSTTPLSNFNLSELNLQNPVMTKSEELLMEGVLTENTIGIVTPLLNMESPGYFVSQMAPTGVIYPIDNAAAIRRFMIYCPVVVCEYHPVEKSVYTAGVTPQGNLVFSRLSATGSAQPGVINVIETNNFNAANNAAEFKAIGASGLAKTYYGKVANTYPAIILKTHKVLFFYVFKTKNGSSGAVGNTIYCKVYDGGLLSAPIKIFAFDDYAKQIGLSGYIFPDIGHLTICQPQLDIPLNSPLFYLAFTCSNKIFLLQGAFTGITFISSISILYGNLSSSASDKSFATAINAMVSASVIYRMRYSISNISVGLYDTDLQGSQRVGLIDYDGKYMGVQFVIGSQVAEIVFDKSYGINGELRIIGDI